MAVVIAGCVAVAWKTSAEKEYRTRMPDSDRFFPSRCQFLFSFPRGFLGARELYSEVGWD